MRKGVGQIRETEFTETESGTEICKQKEGTVDVDSVYGCCCELCCAKNGTSFQSE